MYLWESSINCICQGAVGPGTVGAPHVGGHRAGPGSQDPCHHPSQQQGTWGKQGSPSPKHFPGDKSRTGWDLGLGRAHGRALQRCGELEPRHAGALFSRADVRSGAWASGGSLGSGQEQARLEVLSGP